jgi:hypothetical protein
VNGCANALVCGPLNIARESAEESRAQRARLDSLFTTTLLSHPCRSRSAMMPRVSLPGQQCDHGGARRCSGLLRRAQGENIRILSIGTGDETVEFAKWDLTGGRQVP